MEALIPLGVQPEFKKSLIFRWHAPNGTSANIGYIMRNGQFWTDLTHESLVQPTSATTYLAALASALDLEIETTSGRPVIRHNGEAPKIQTTVENVPAWTAALAGLRASYKSES